MTEFSGYRSPRRPEFLFLSNDWRSHEIYESFHRYEQDFLEIVDDATVNEDFYVVGERNGRIGFDEFQGLAYAGDIDVAIADMELEAEGINGEIRYETHLPGEGAARIKASFEVNDPELEREVEEYVSKHFDSFLGLDTGYNPVQALR
ncbi:MAG: hypothetical protein ABEJ87_04655 [Candidatus Nanohalobium sp.]